jgi:hypothetical protein
MALATLAAPQGRAARSPPSSYSVVLDDVSVRSWSRHPERMAPETQHSGFQAPRGTHPKIRAWRLDTRRARFTLAMFETGYGRATARNVECAIVDSVTPES